MLVHNIILNYLFRLRILVMDGQIFLGIIMDGYYWTRSGTTEGYNFGEIAQDTYETSERRHYKTQKTNYLTYAMRNTHANPCEESFT